MSAANVNETYINWARQKDMTLVFKSHFNITMRTPSLLIVAITTSMYAVHAMPNSNLAARETVNDLDRDSIQGSGVHFVKRAQEEVKGWKGASKRFVRNPDYSQGGSEGGSNSVSPATKSKATPEAPAPDAPVATAKVDPGAKPAARV